ncbi:MAG: polyphosphate kinase 2 family protein [Burkholderiales bacterium]|jgi:PPK2 family polyphosphate:nucleotide phosphotransferase|nr:polyphosphate kinase 2 family protein [Burkholderiales bacterium]
MPSSQQIIDRIEKAIRPYRVVQGRKFRLRDHDPADTGMMDGEDKPQAKEWLARGVQWLAEQQDKLYAQDRRSLLLVFQAMDAAGKDGTIKHVMSGVNPQGVQVVSFKQPTALDLDHDYMWRYWRELPERGRIGIFNRSYYEEVLVVRVHRAILQGQKLPPECVRKRVFDERLADIAHFEDYLSRQGTKVLKFFLNVSKAEQKRRFMERLDEPGKNWKFSAADVRERAYWDDYQTAYEDAIRATATPQAPWYVVPADNKWYLRLVVVASIVQALEQMELAYPCVGKAQKAELAAARTALEREGRTKG